MNMGDLTALSPFIMLSITAIVVMLAISQHRSHLLTVVLTLSGLALTLASISGAICTVPREVTSLIMIDRYALFFLGLIVVGTFAIAALSFSYFEGRSGEREEFYLLLLLATLGAMVLTAATHFASLFLGIELLSVSLYALTAYHRHSLRSTEAGVKYLILAAASSAVLLFGMALVYAETGSMTFTHIASRIGASGTYGLPLTAGLAMILAGLGFKLAVVPFHLWTPDVYEGAPAPVTAFVATISKGAVFAVLFRIFTSINIHERPALLLIMSAVAVASMFVGNLLALQQNNVKRILAYSSISHLGYLLVTLLASGPMASAAAAFYLVAYFITTIGAFGVVSMVSGKDRDADLLEDYQGLAWRRPWLAAVFSAMLFSLAGIPLTAGFVGKFYVVGAGAESSLWTLVVVLVINSAIGLFYYLRIIAALFERNDEQAAQHIASAPGLGSAVLACLMALLILFGVYPGPMIEIIKKAMHF
jgi:NADH-quinone oxidoreductase subunit N